MSDPARGENPTILTLEEDGSGRLLASHPEHDAEGRNVVFSGQLLGQMIMAVDRATDGARDVRSIQAIFSRAGTYDSALELEVESTHAGRSFGNHTVTAYQDGRALARGLVLTSADEPDLLRHGPTLPDVVPPDELAADQTSLAYPGSETRTVPHSDDTGAHHNPYLSFWIRCDARVYGVAAHQAVLAWSQPGELIGLALRAHADRYSIADAHRTLSTGVIAHTAHFQERFDVTDWLLVQQWATAAGRGRIYGEGRVFDRDGRLVSTFSQDSMVRHAATAQDPRTSL